MANLCTAVPPNLIHQYHLLDISGVFDTFSHIENCVPADDACLRVLSSDNSQTRTKIHSKSPVFVLSLLWLTGFSVSVLDVGFGLRSKSVSQYRQL